MLLHVTCFPPLMFGRMVCPDPLIVVVPTKVLTQSTGVVAVSVPEADAAPATKANNQTLRRQKHFMAGHL